MDIKVFIDKLFARAKEVGFECCEAMIETSNNFTVGVLKGEIIQYKVSDSFGLGFRGLYGGKMGYATTQIADESAIDFLVNGAKNVAELIDSEDKVPLWPGSPSYPKMDLYSPALDEITAAEKIEMAKQLERETVAADPRVDRVERSIVYSAAGSTRIVNTLGLDVETTSNLLGGYVIAVATDGDDTQAGVEQFVARDRKEIDLKGVAARAAKNATANLNADIPNSCNPAIILRWDAASEILETFSGIFNAEVAHKGLSLLKGREGEKIAADCFTLVDDPHMARGMACQPFDGEGVATTVKSVIENGVLKTLLYTLKSATREGRASTGNAGRSYNSTVGTTAMNLHPVPTDLTLEDLAAEMGEGILVSEVMGLHSGADAVTGDFSLGAKGFEVRDGKIGKPLKGFTVSGNFYELMKNVRRVGGDMVLEFSAVFSPSLIVDGLSVAGK